MVISARIQVPDDTGALLWDLDGVVLDTLTMEYAIVQELVAHHAPQAAAVTRELVRSCFALSIPDFWRAILGAVGAPVTDALVATLTRCVGGRPAER